MHVRLAIAVAVVCLLVSGKVSAQTAVVEGTVRDEAGGALPGVSVECRGESGLTGLAVTDDRGAFAIGVPPGRVQLSFVLINFATAHRELAARPAAAVRADVVLRLALNADVTVTGRTTFTNLADAPDPARTSSASRSPPARARSRRVSSSAGRSSEAGTCSKPCRAS
jgi:hypothetical protein